MHKLFLHSASPITLLFAKELVCEYRSRYAVAVLSAFSFITVTSISITLANRDLTDETVSVLLWTIIFFSAMAGLGRTYSTEKENNTLIALRVYCAPQAVVLGKMSFNIVLLLGVAGLVLPLFISFFGLIVRDWRLLLMTMLMGGGGIAAVSTLLSSLAVEAKGAFALFTVINFPVLMPLMLNVIDLTADSLRGIPANFDQLGLLIGFDIVIAAITLLVTDWL